MIEDAMHLLFDEDFVPAIRKGNKTTTIRRQCPFKVGDEFDLMTVDKMGYEVFGTARVSFIFRVSLYRDIAIVSETNAETKEIVPIGRIDKWKAKHEFARTEGFTSWTNMVNWFDKYKTMPFAGYLIEWENYSYRYERKSSCTTSPKS